VEGLGLYVGPSSSGNCFTGFFMEANAAGDADIRGNDNQFDVCTMSSHASTAPYDRIKSATLREGSVGNRFRGGTAYYAILVESGALASRFQSLECHRIDDAGSGTIIDDVKQLYRSATRFPSRTFGNVEDSNPNALDWYREVAFRPSFSGSRTSGTIEFDVEAGSGTRIGNVFLFSLVLRIAAVGAAPAGDLFVTGLPFPASRTIGSAVCVGEVAGLPFPPGTSQLGAAAVEGQALLRLSALGPDGNSTPLNAAILRAGSTVKLSGHYLVS
jgi:hypothetical protein